MKQKTGQSAIDFMASVEIQARRAGIEGDQLRCVIVQGLLPNTHQFAVTREGNDINSLRKWLSVSDAAAVPDPKEDNSSVVKDIQRRLEEMRVHAAYPTDVKERVLPRSASQSPDGTQGTIRSALSVIVSFTRLLRKTEVVGRCPPKEAGATVRASIAELRSWSTSWRLT